MRNQIIKSKSFFIAAGWMLIATLVLPVFAQLSDRADKMRFVPDVRGQFRALTERADALGFHIGSSPNPSNCKHYQSITRVDGTDGTPFFLVTRSGNKPPLAPCSDSPKETGNGHLIVFRMDSRDKNGERLRSNRLRKGVHVNDTPPEDEDRATTYFIVVGGDPNDPDPAKRPGLIRKSHRDTEYLETPPPRVYQHPGGMQLVGNILALVVEKPRQYLRSEEFCSFCLENPQSPFCVLPTIEDCSLPYERAPDPAMVMFFDVSNPENPRFLSRFVPRNANGVFQNAGIVAVTPMPDGAYLMAVSGGNNKPIFFFRSTTDSLLNPDLDWDLVGQSSDINTPSFEDHQTLQFIREGNVNGRLYLAGARNDAIVSGNDRLDLYRVLCTTSNCRAGEEIRLDNSDGVGYHGQLILPFPNTGGTRLANLAAASGFYVSPSGELLFYATEHDNDGPDGTVKAGEWRHREIVRANSPTYLPTANLFGPYQVDEGSGVTVSGEAEPPITKAWIQLYQAHPSDNSLLYPVVDFDDYGRDDYSDFSLLEPLTYFDPMERHIRFNNTATSWKWFAPVGCSIRAIDYGTNPATVRTLGGAGAVVSEENLGDLSQKIDAVEFSPACNSFYGRDFYNLAWDLDVNGSFETAGETVTFNARNFDGPSVVNLPAQTRHVSAGGANGAAAVAVMIRNVAPSLSQFRLTNNAGQTLNVPFILTKVPINAAAYFSDPGVLDRQTATMNWGDGAVEQQNLFAVFNEAYGDGSGAVSHGHRYNSPGLYQISLTVRDDDGGEDIETLTLRVRNPEQAVVEIIALLDNIIASTTNNNISRNLEKARKALAGSNANSNNGALNKIRAGNTQSALTFLRQAIDDLRRAMADGADVASLISLLEQTASSLSAQ